MQPRLFQLGNDHLLLNGDSTDADHLLLLYSAAKELGIDKAEICLTDPPYNSHLSLIDTHDENRSLRYNTDCRKTPILNDSLDSLSYFYFLHAVLRDCRFLFHNTRLLMFYSPRQSIEVFKALERLELPLKSVLIWIKNRPSINYSEFCFQSEFIVYAGTTDSKRRNKNKGQSNLFYCPQVQTNKETYYWHPTMKPIKLLRDLLDATTIVGDVIIDPFAGTGSSLVAAHRTGRKWLGVELDPKYCIATLMRYRYETAKQQPVYEIIDGQRMELDDAELELQFKECNAQQGA